MKVKPTRPAIAMSADPNMKPDPAPAGSEQELCAQCMTANPAGSHFCRKCNAPLSSYASTGPFESLFAEGHVYRNAAKRPQRFIVVFGVWLVFGAIALAGGFTAVLTWGTGSPMSVLVGIGMVAISVLLIGKTTKNYRNRKATDDTERH
jgi:hypothetical protein